MRTRCSGKYVQTWFWRHVVSGETYVRSRDVLHRLLAGLMSVVLLLCLPTSGTYACSPPPGPPPTLQERLDAASVAFAGQVVRTGGRVVSNTGLPDFDLVVDRDLLGQRFERFFDAEYLVAAMPYYAIVRVERYYKGSGGGEVAVMGFGYGSDCLNSAEAGDAFLFFTTGDSPLYALRYLYPHAGVMRYDRRTENELAVLGYGAGTAALADVPYTWLPVGGIGAVVVLLLLRGMGGILRFGKKRDAV